MRRRMSSRSRPSQYSARRITGSTITASTFDVRALQTSSPCPRRQASKRGHPEPAGPPVPWGMADGAFPRSLNSSERAVIEVILSAGPGRDALRSQLDHAKVVGTWAAGPSIDIEVPNGLPRHGGADGILPTCAQVRDASGDAVGELLLWIA